MVARLDQNLPNTIKEHNDANITAPQVAKTACGAVFSWQQIETVITKTERMESANRKRFIDLDSMCVRRKGVRQSA